MADSSTSTDSTSKANIEEVKSVFRSQLKGWREVIVYLESIFIWSQPQDPGILVAIVSLAFVLIWVLDASILTTFSVLGIIVCLSDYTLPLIAANFFDSSQWSAKDENKFEGICGELAGTWCTLTLAWNRWQVLKQDSPKFYSVSLIASLVVLAWVGNLVNNLFLSYLIALSIVMSPGLKHNGILQEYVGKAVSFVTNTVGSKLKQN